jgi:hypothetical protein
MLELNDKKYVKKLKTYLENVNPVIPYVENVKLFELRLIVILG